MRHSQVGPEDPEIHADAWIDTRDIDPLPDEWGAAKQESLRRVAILGARAKLLDKLEQRSGRRKRR